MTGLLGLTAILAWAIFRSSLGKAGCDAYDMEVGLRMLETVWFFGLVNGEKENRLCSILSPGW